MPGEGSACGRYASYRNAYLFCIILLIASGIAGNRVKRLSTGYWNNCKPPYFLPSYSSFNAQFTIVYANDEETAPFLNSTGKNSPERNKIYQQESISVGCVSTACCPYPVVSGGGGRVWFQHPPPPPRCRPPSLQRQTPPSCDQWCMLGSHPHMDRQIWVKSLPSPQSRLYQRLLKRYLIKQKRGV